MSKLNKENIWHAIFFILACFSIIAVALICYFLFVNGSAAIAKIGLVNFITGTKWKPLNEIFGILPMIVGSILVTLLAILIGLPIGIFSAMFMAFFCPKKLYGFIKPFVSLLAGIPSVVYGFFGVQVLVPIMGDLTGMASGKSMLTGAILLAIMILPTIIEISESALRAVPKAYYNGARALGATHERSVYKVMLKAASSGVIASAVLGIGRAIGETLAIIWVAGNQPIMPRFIGAGAKGFLSGVRTLTANIVLEMGYAADIHREALIGTGLVLFVFILIINLSFSLIKRRMSNHE